MPDASLEKLGESFVALLVQRQHLGRSVGPARELLRVCRRVQGVLPCKHIEAFTGFGQACGASRVVRWDGGFPWNGMSHLT